MAGVCYTPSSLVGKSVVLVGGAGLIGQSLALAIGQSGAFPIVVDQDLDALGEIEGKFRSSGIEGQTVQMAVKGRSEASNLLDVLTEDGRDVHGMVVAAYPGRTRSGGSTPTDFREKLAAHAGLFFDLNNLFGEFFSRNKGGSVVNLSSIYGANSPRFQLYAGTHMTVSPDYVAAKAAINAVTRYFAAVFVGSGVRFNAVAPGGIADNQPASFQSAYAAMCGAIGLLNPEDLAGLVVYLLSDSARAVTGQIITVDDGWSL